MNHNEKGFSKDVKKKKSFFFPPGTLSMLLFRVGKGGGYHKEAVKKDTPLVLRFSCISKCL